MANIEATEDIEVGDLRVEVTRKRIKNLHLGVYPPDGRIRVAAPAAISLDAIRVSILTRLSWIKRKQAEFLRQERETKRSYVSGETIHVFGRPHRLVVREAVGRPGITVLPGGRVELLTRPGATLVDRERQIENWQRRQLREKAGPKISRWARQLEVAEPQWGIKIMKTKWGSCNPDSGSVWINLDLVKKPTQCLDYVILHEMAHFISRQHDDLFISVLDRFMPSWRQVRSDLNALPLRHEPSFA